MKRTSLKLNNEARFKLAVHTALLASLSTTAGTAVAQTTETPAAGASKDESTELETLQVTGSRLPSPGIISSSPVSTVSADDIQAMGVTRIEDIINQMPQVFAGQGAYISNGATGTATVDLRNLGPARTLVLIDGKRLMPGDPRITSAAPDLNNIPAALVESVDIMTGGASAVYGSDALAGVVNFKMKRDFEGVRLNFQHSFYQHSNDDNDMVSDAVKRRLAAGGSPVEFAIPDSNVIDGERNVLTLVTGMNSANGKGNATLYATYQTVNAVDQGERTFSECAIARDVANQRYNCSGSGTASRARFTDFATFNYATIDSGVPGVGAFRNFSNATDQFNFNPYNYFQRNDERYGLGTFAHYEVNDTFDVFTDIMYMDDRTDAVIAPSGSFLGQVTFDCSNPLIGNVDPDGAGPQLSQLAALCGGNPAAGARTMYLGRRNVEGGGRDDDLRHTSIRAVLGTRGELVEGFDYEVFYQYGETQLAQIYRNDFSITRLSRAVDVVDNDPGAGVDPQCRSFADGTDPNCVPWNIWVPGGVTPEALAYLQTPGLLQGHTKERVLGAQVSTDLSRFGIAFPMASEGVAVLVGSEYRKEESIFEPDTAFSTGDLAGQGGATLSAQGQFEVNELFTEMRIPIVQNMPLVEDLAAELGYRYSNYGRAGTADSYKLAMAYAPTKDVSFRVALNRAVRAPNVIELSSPLSVSLDGNTDPCAGAAMDVGPDGLPGTADDVAGNGDANDFAADGGATRAQCANDPYFQANPGDFGTIVANPAAQYNGLQGSSPGLKPEEADTYTVGVVFTPTFLKDFSLTLDYYDITVDGLVGGYGADTILNACYGGNTALCSLINRDPNLGSLWISPNGYVIDTIQNTGSLGSTGFDLGMTYEMKLADLGGLKFDLRGTYIDSEDHQPIPGGETFGCEGTYGLECGTPIPRWRHKLRGTWALPMVSASLQWRHFKEVEADRVTAPVTINDDKKLEAENYFDLAFSVPFMSQYEFTGGINNILDEDPSVINQSGLPSVTGSGNTFPQVYDALGRYVFLGVNVDF